MAAMEAQAVDSASSEAAMEAQAVDSASSVAAGAQLVGETEIQASAGS